jgi:uncharacterized protein
MAASVRAAALELGRTLGVRHEVIESNEMERPGFARNPTDRCYHCKAELLDIARPAADRLGLREVLLGTNLDDLGDHRPGQRAAAERGASFPLVDTGFTKQDVRSWSQRLGLRTWDKPAAACLASRVPYGTEVTVALLSQVDRAEAAMKRLGFAELRVRHYGDTARIEVPLAELGDVIARRADVVEAIKASGYAYVTLDLEGFRSGNLNAALDSYNT